MFDFTLTDKQKMFQEMTREFSRSMVRPIALEADRTGKYPDDLLITLHQAQAGQGRDIRDSGVTANTSENAPDAEEKRKRQTNMLLAILTEELSWGDPCAVLNIPGPGLGGPPVQFMGTPEQRERFFAPFKNMSKPLFGAYALTEPGAGSDSKAIRTSCRKDGDHYIINGTKCFITNGNKALWNVVFATVDPKLGRDGFRVFVIEKGTPGFLEGKVEKKMGLRASETAELVFEDCLVHESCLLGGEKHYETKEGFKGAMKTFDSTRPLVAAMAVGIARAAFEIARDWVKENYTLSRPIERYRTLSDRLSKLDREIHAARMLTWRACWLADEGIPNSKEASMCKVYAAQVAQRATEEAVQIMGPYGVLKNHFVEKLFRDQKVYDIFEGTGQVQRIVISRRIYESIGG
ncbi:MAG: acyl-CoA dehydrogenase family protein [Planctomycetes bacterium]|nr:acyl-CoA dehydrogenase family protein [Planctomycetota bacterium]